MDQQGKMLIVCIYVDDMIYTGNLMLEEFKIVKKNEFEMTDLGLMKYFLGLEVTQIDQGIFIVSISMLLIFYRDSEWINVNQQKPPFL